MENELIHSLSVHLGNRLNQYVNKESLELQKMILGIEIMIINISKLIIVLALASLLGILIQTVTVQLSFAILKRYSFGTHAKNSTVCTLVSCTIFVLLPYLFMTAGINNLVVIPLFVFIIAMLFNYAPADTEARPLLGKENRIKLKRKAVVSGLILMVFALLIRDENIKLLISLGAGCQVITILPLTYKILNRRMDNYENYE